MSRALILVLFVLTATSLAAQQGAGDPPRKPTTPPVWHPTLEHVGPGGTIQTEFGSALSESGFNKLRKAITWISPSERTDYYFDAYDGHQFLLRTGGMPLKVRIKVKKQKTEWQVSRFVAKDQVAVGPLSIKVHTTESWQGKLEGALSAQLLAASDDFASRLASGGAALRAAADAAESKWRQLRDATLLPGVMLIDRLLAGQNYHFYPRKVTAAKTRYSAKLPGVSAPTVSLMLGSEPEVDRNGRVVMTYELEAEPDAAVTPKQVAAISRAIGQWMLAAGLTPHDQEEVLSLSNDYTLLQLGR